VKDVKTTNHQLLTFTALSTLGGSILVVSATMAAVAQQDAWLSVLVNMAYGSVMIAVFCYLGSRFQGLTLIGIIKEVFGTWTGFIIAAAYVIFLLFTAISIPWFIGSFGAHAMLETPQTVINTLYVAALVIAVVYGIEAFMRASELLYSLFSVLFIISIVLVLPNASSQYIQPVFEKGFTPILKGSVLLAGFVSFPVITMLMIYPKYAEDLRRGKKALYKGFIWANTVVIVTVLVSVLVLGSAVVSKSSFPTLLLARQIYLGTILTRLEYAISVMWTVSEFIIGVLYFYGAISGLSELLCLKNHKKIILPVGLIVLLYADNAWPNTIEQTDWFIKVWTPHVIVFGAILPLFILGTYLVRKKSLDHA
jgi:spore germination protein KB